MYGSSPLELMARDAMLAGYIFCDNFTYSAEWLTGTATALGANATVPVSIQIDSDADFLIQSVNLVAYATGTPPTLIADPNYRVLLTSAGSGRQLMNQAQHVGTYCGNYQSNHVPGALNFPKFLAANSRLQCTITNLTSTAADSVELGLRGFKIYYIDDIQRARQENRQLATRQTIFHAL